MKELYIALRNIYRAVNPRSKCLYAVGKILHTKAFVLGYRNLLNLSLLLLEASASKGMSKKRIMAGRINYRVLVDHDKIIKKLLDEINSCLIELNETIMEQFEELIHKKKKTLRKALNQLSLKYLLQIKNVLIAASNMPEQLCAYSDTYEDWKKEKEQFYQCYNAKHDNVIDATRENIEYFIGMCSFDPKKHIFSDDNTGETDSD